MKDSPNLWAVMPAAGIGQRMDAAVPKQYISVLGKTLLEHSLQSFITHPCITKTVVVIAAHDKHWSNISAKLPAEKIITTVGGKERCHSVHAGLVALAAIAQPQDWVLVHDAVRPCLTHQDLDRLIANLAQHPVGGLFGLPVRDTLKRTDLEGGVIATIDRTEVWQAQTPQMFRLQPLTKALEHGLATSHTLTDEASAIELSGAKPQMVSGPIHNVKVTYPDDLLLIEHLL